MKILFYNSSSLLNEHLGTLIDEVTILSKENHQIYFLYDDCCLSMCRHNMSGHKSTCSVCQLMWKNAINKLFPKNVQIIKLSNYWNRNAKYEYEYKSAQDIKHIRYKNVLVGYSVMSTYISTTRNLNPLLNESTRYYFDCLINTTCQLTDAVNRALDDIQPDRVDLFNCRYFEWRPMYDVAINRGIDTHVHELTGGRAEPFYKTEFLNCTPHGVKTNHERYQRLWNEVNWPEKQKMDLGISFFEKRRNGIVSGDKVYIGEQTKGELPANWDANKRNIAIFNSSEDEFASIGDEYEQLALFKSQYQGIVFLLENTKDDNIHYYLRIHPNLKDIPYRYHTDLLDLSKKYKNITVIPGNSSVSTYTLMDAAEKVVVFGSTMGMESAYWGKPVILLAGAIYYYSDICYVPQNTNELLKLIDNHLLTKDNLNAIKIAFYYLYRDEAKLCKYIDIDFGWFTFLGHELKDIKYQKILGSSKLFAIFALYYHKYMNIVKHQRYDVAPVPWEEE